MDFNNTDLFGADGMSPRMQSLITPNIEFTPYEIGTEVQFRHPTGGALISGVIVSNENYPILKVRVTKPDDFLFLKITPGIDGDNDILTVVDPTIGKYEDFYENLDVLTPEGSETQTIFESSEDLETSGFTSSKTAATPSTPEKFVQYLYKLSANIQGALKIALNDEGLAKSLNVSTAPDVLFELNELILEEIQPPTVLKAKEIGQAALDEYTKIYNEVEDFTQFSKSTPRPKGRFLDLFMILSKFDTLAQQISSGKVSTKAVASTLDPLMTSPDYPAAEPITPEELEASFMGVSIISALLHKARDIVQGVRKGDLSSLASSFAEYKSRISSKCKALHPELLPKLSAYFEDPSNKTSLSKKHQSSFKALVEGGALNSPEFLSKEEDLNEFLFATDEVKNSLESAVLG